MAAIEFSAEFLAEESEPPPLTPTQMAWQRFRRHKMAMFGALLIIAIILYIIIGSVFLSEADANRTDLTIKLSPPSWLHPSARTW